jgi:hypothetical protein
MNANLIDAVAEWEREQDLEKSRTVMLALEVANEIPAHILVDTMWPQPLGSQVIRVFINLAQLLVKDEGGQYVWKDGKTTHDEAAELLNSKAATAWFTARYPEATKEFRQDSGNFFYMARKSMEDTNGKYETIVFLEFVRDAKCVVNQVQKTVTQYVYDCGGGNS